MSIFSWMGNFFKEPPVAEQIENKEKVDEMYSHWRMRIFY